MLKGFFFDAVSKTAVISLVLINLTQKYCQDIYIELLYDHIRFHPDQLTIVQENEANMLCFALTL